MNGALNKSDKASNQLSFKKCPKALCIHGLGYFCVPDLGPPRKQIHLSCVDAVYLTFCKITIVCKVCTHSLSGEWLVHFAHI